MRRPRIAIPEIDQNVKNYARAVYEAEMEPIVISVQSKQIRQQFQQEYLDYSDFRPDTYDGLLPGGCDIDPVRYGEENQGSSKVMDDLDEMQLSMLDCFVKREKPVLGICRGHQLINVYFGGSLVQHLSTADTHRDPTYKKDPVHPCAARDQSWRARLSGNDFYLNSAHHQAVKRLGEGLIVDGWCSLDHVIEAMHHAQLPVYGVQFHPERMCLDLERTDTVDGLLIFHFFYELCRNPEKEINYDMYHKKSRISDGYMI